MNVKITIDHALKKYEKNIVIPDLSLVIDEGEFFTLLGPSGCGKTTLLRMIAGFNTVEGGEFYFNDKLINNLDPARRNIGMVFQNYAIFPHLNVKENVKFGLKNRGFSKSEIEDIANKYLKLMQIDQFADRMPERLSGGQQQRVALARALAISPDVLLMDEPLSNLDAKLRIEMRQVIKDIQRQVGITTVYVTHDQEEAMAVSDRIAVMNAGVIQQIGSPRDLYQRPDNVFVATFIGRTNMLHGKRKDNTIRICDGYSFTMDNLMPSSLNDVLVSVRPEEFIICDVNESEGIDAVVKSSTFLGLSTQYILELSTGDSVDLIRESVVGKDLVPGQKIKVRFKTEKINIFEDNDEAKTVVKKELAL